MSVAEKAGPPAIHVVMHVATKSPAWIASWRTAAIAVLLPRRAGSASDGVVGCIEATMKSRDPDAGFVALQAELMAEAAQSLGIAGKRMEQALATLAACPEAAKASTRRALLDAAAQATFAYVVQRESLGWRDTESALDLYEVPNEVRVRLGARVFKTP